MSESVEKAKKSKRLTLAYHRAFETPEGKLVLDDLRSVFGTHMPAFIPQARGRHCEYDPTHAAIRDGQRQVVLHIETKLSKTPVPDGNDDQPQTTVKT